VCVSKVDQKALEEGKEREKDVASNAYREQENRNTHVLTVGAMCCQEQSGQIIESDLCSP
jgi:hypothetical protein